ncbi:MAG: hypothetical protein AAGM38_16130 [Pseudomonadota bacterium]
MREDHALGRVSNAFRTLDLARTLRVGGGNALGDAFRLLASEGARRDALRERQAREKQALLKAQAVDVREAKKSALERCRSDLSAARTKFLAARDEALERRAEEIKGLKAAWRERTTERKLAWDAYKAAAHANVALADDFRSASSPASYRRRSDEGGGVDRFLDDMRREYGGNSDHANDKANESDDDYGY